MPFKRAIINLLCVWVSFGYHWNFLRIKKFPSPMWGRNFFNPWLEGQDVESGQHCQPSYTAVRSPLWCVARLTPHMPEVPSSTLSHCRRWCPLKLRIFMRKENLETLWTFERSIFLKMYFSDLEHYWMVFHLPVARNLRRHAHGNEQRWSSSTSCPSDALRGRAQRARCWLWSTLPAVMYFSDLETCWIVS